jgi:hypothetical protein
MLNQVGKNMGSRQQHPLFMRYPLDGKVTVGGQDVPTPYHIYDGSILFIGGTCDAVAARRLLEGERLTPILDQQGRALMAVWVCDFTQASLGAHHELQISLFASFQPQKPIPAHPFAIYRLLTLNPAAMMVCHGLWNNTPLVVDYNCEHLGLDAHLSESQYERAAADSRWRFSVRDADSGAAVAEGDVHEPVKQDGRVLWGVMRYLGLQGFWQSARSPFVQVPVVNTVNNRLPENQIARTFTKNDRQVIRLLDAQKDRLTIQHSAYALLNFRPDFIQHGAGVRFVYLRPVRPQ